MSEAEPREGLEGSLPECVQVVFFEGRHAVWHGPCSEGPQHVVVRGLNDVEWRAMENHPGVTLPSWGPTTVRLEFWDTTEARAAYKNSAEWVRTGELE